MSQLAARPDEPSPNPYQPPTDASHEVDLTAPIEVAFRWDSRARRFATEQYLLHWHTKLLLISSLLMIFASGGLLFATATIWPVAFMPCLVFCMVASALVYLSLVRKTKREIVATLRRVGVDCDDEITLRSDPEQLQMSPPDGRTHRWGYDEIRLYRTRRGTLICTEPLLFVLVPSLGDISAKHYRDFFKVLRTRIKQSRA